MDDNDNIIDVSEGKTPNFVKTFYESHFKL